MRLTIALRWIAITVILFGIRDEVAMLRKDIAVMQQTAIARHDSLMANIKKPVWWR
jgi:hypothetical protein